MIGPPLRKLGFTCECRGRREEHLEQNRFAFAAQRPVLDTGPDEGDRSGPIAAQQSGCDRLQLPFEQHRRIVPGHIFNQAEHDRCLHRVTEPIECARRLEQEHCIGAVDLAVLTDDITSQTDLRSFTDRVAGLPQDREPTIEFLLVRGIGLSDELIGHGIDVQRWDRHGRLTADLELSGQTQVDKAGDDRFSEELFGRAGGHGAEIAEAAGSDERGIRHPRIQGSKSRQHPGAEERRIEAGVRVMAGNSIWVFFRPGDEVGRHQ